METREDARRTGRALLAGRKDLRGVDVASNWLLLLTESEIEQGVKKVAAEIDRRFEGKDIVIVCILKGCVYFFVDLTRHLTIPYSTYFVEASSYHNAQVQSDSVELLSVIVPSKFEGKHIILLDELYDNGATMCSVKGKLRETLGRENDNEIFTCCLFQKEKEQSYPPPDLVGFERVPNVWVVGYGLDDRQEKRGWRDLWALPKIEGLPRSDADAMFDEGERGNKRYLEARSALLSSIK